jgi:hypothetical protein
MRISVPVSTVLVVVVSVVSSTVDAAKFLLLAIAMGFALDAFAVVEEDEEDLLTFANDFEVLVLLAKAEFKVASFFAFTLLMYSFK